MKVLRPWGPLPWLDTKLGERRWSFLGVCGTETRCVSALGLLAPERRDHCRFLRINDPESGDRHAYQDRLDHREVEVLAMSGVSGSVRTADLLANIDTIRDEVSNFLDAAHSDVVLDITSMPKWWFFPVLRFLLADARVGTLLVTYTSGSGYARHLASNTQALEALPTFETRDGRTSYQELIVGIGFAPLELADLYAEQLERVRYLFPFPPGPPSFERNWRFLQDLEERIGHERQRADDRWHVNMHDTPSIFEALERFTDKGRRSSALAPFGPKTVSLAMCLFSLASENAGRGTIPAFYTQPTRYALDYTAGPKLVDGIPDVRAYAIRIDGRDLYTIH